MAKFKKAPELKKVETNEPKYDPTKSYKWEPTDEFILTGLEFDNVFRSLRGLSQAPEYQRFLQLQEGLRTLEAIFVEAVEAGLVREMEPPAEGQI